MLEQLVSTMVNHYCHAWLIPHSSTMNQRQPLTIMNHSNHPIVSHRSTKQLQPLLLYHMIKKYPFKIHSIALLIYLLIGLLKHLGHLGVHLNQPYPTSINPKYCLLINHSRFSFARLITNQFHPLDFALPNCEHVCEVSVSPMMRLHCRAPSRS